MPKADDPTVAVLFTPGDEGPVLGLEGEALAGVATSAPERINGCRFVGEEQTKSVFSLPLWAPRFAKRRMFLAAIHYLALG